MTDPEAIPSVPSGSYPAREGNHLRPLVDGEPAFRRLCEAISSARTSVWATVTFMWPSFQMPGGLGSALDVLDSAAKRGVDVRVIFWRPDTSTETWKPNAFWGSEDHIRQLEARMSGIRIRWDGAHPGYCQHQKSWLIDAGEDGETAFLGGLNLNPHSVAAPGHRGEGQNHDVSIELTGPSTADVHHNFVQRWDEASERRLERGRWGAGSEIDLPFPAHVPPRRGNATVQIQRTIHAGRYRAAYPAPEAPPFDIALGERSILDQYLAAIGAARISIYIENQYIDVPEIIEALKQALARGVEVVALVPSNPFFEAGRSDEWHALVNPLFTYHNFTLAGIAGIGPDGRRKPVYVHSKLMLIDDAWGTVGSSNLHRFSLFGNSELNAAFWDSITVRGFRSELFQEHLGFDTSTMDDLAALRLFRTTAMDNRRRFDAGDAAWQGLAFALSPADNVR